MNPTCGWNKPAPCLGDDREAAGAVVEHQICRDVPICSGTAVVDPDIDVAIAVDVRRRTSMREIFQLRQVRRRYVVKFAVTGGEKKLILFPWPFRGIALWIFWSSITSKKIETPVPIKVLYDKVPYPHCFRGRARNYLRGAIVESSVSIIEQDDDGTRHPSGPTQLIRRKQEVDGVIVAVAVDIGNLFIQRGTKVFSVISFSNRK